MGHKKPADDHPWRRYKNRYYKPTEGKKKINKKRVGILVKELGESWDTIEVFVDTKNGGKYLLRSLTQEKQAVWLINLLKNYEKETIYQT